jgi:hypothetical protein
MKGRASGGSLRLGPVSKRGKARASLEFVKGLELADIAVQGRTGQGLTKGRWGDCAAVADGHRRMWAASGCSGVLAANSRALGSSFQKVSWGRTAR